MFKQKSDSSVSTPRSEPVDAVQQARTRARHRLIGAVVLLAAGVIVFPLVFETQPRPIPVDIPIEIPRRDAVPPLAMPSAPTAAAQTASEPARPAMPASPPHEAGPRLAAKPAPGASKPAARPADVVITESLADAGREVAPARAASDGERAQALLEARPVPGADGTRFVVQVGAFADAEAAREARKQVERLGLKTYTQVAQTANGNRIRVRVGPFASRLDADAAVAKVKAAHLAAVVLTL